MSKANSVYLVMLAAFAVGLWTILSFGSIFLHAPPDLAGRWELRPAGASQSAPPAHLISIQQSGKFIQLNLDGKAYPLKLMSQQVVRNTIGLDEQSLQLAGHDLQMTFQGRADSDVYHLQTSGKLIGDWEAIRVIRTYPKRLADQPATKPSIDHAR